MKNQRSKGFVFSLVIVVAAVLFVLPTAFRAQAATEYTEGYLKYTVADGKATITDCDTSISGSFTIPSKLGSYPVTDIGSYAFEKCSNLTSVTIPNSVTRIGSWSFSYCTSLAYIAIPDSVTYIGWSAFTETAWYDSQPNGSVYAGKVYYKYKGIMPNNTYIVIKEDTRGIASCAFEYRDEMTGVTIPYGVIDIGVAVFRNCTGLTSITLPNSVLRIDSDAFYGCANLSYITIPDSVVGIGGSAFKNTAWYRLQPDGDVYAGKVYYDFKGTMQSGASVVMKNGTKGIAGSALQGCNLKQVTIPSGVTNIGERAFENSAITSVTIPSSVKSIGFWAFHNCNALKSVTICNNECVIDDASYTFPDNVKIIGFSGSTAEAYAKKHYLNFEVHKHTIFSWTLIKTATCTESGNKQGICPVCENTETQSIPALGHNYSWKTDKAATCTENGSKSQHCTRCGDKKDVTLIAATGHKFSSWKTVKKATCTKAGNQSRTCSVCKKAETKKLSALGHSYKITRIKAKATLSKNGSAVAKCKRCGLTNSKTVIYKIKTVKLSASSFVYNGKAKTPTVTVKDSKGNTLKKNTDYTAKYSSGRKSIGAYTVTVTFKGNYSGKKSLKFEILPGKVGSIRQLSKEGINFTWDSVNGATGYEVYFYDVSGKSYVKLATTKTTKLGNSSAKGKMTIKIRAFKKVGNKTYYGSFSKPVTFEAK